MQSLERHHAVSDIVELEDLAKQWGAMSGKVGVAVDFDAYVHGALRSRFVALHGDPGLDPATLTVRRQAAEAEADRLEHQLMLGVSAPEKGNARVNFGASVAIVTTAVLLGLLAEARSVPVALTAWGALAAGTLLAILVYHGLPQATTHLVAAWTFVYVAARRAMLQRRIRRLALAESEARARHAEYQEFLRAHAQRLRQVFEFYRACAARISRPTTAVEEVA